MRLLICVLLISWCAYANSNALGDARASRELAAQGQTSEALKLSLQAAKQMAKDGKKFADILPFVYDDIAGLYFKLSDFQNAKIFADKALKRVIQNPSSNANEAARAHIQNTRASIAFSSGEFVLAEKAYEESYAYYSNQPSQWQRSIQVAFNLIAFYLEKGSLQKASSIAEDSLALLRDKHDADLHVQMYVYQLKIAMQTGEHKLAEQALIAAENMHATCSEGVLHKFKLAKAQYLIFSGKILDAVTVLQELITDLSSGGKTTNLHLAAAHYALGNAYVLQGKIVEAHDTYLNALEEYRSSLPANHPAIGRSIHGLAIVSKNIGRLDASERYYMRAIEIFKHAFGTEHKTVAASRLEYSLLLLNMQRPHDAQLQSKLAIEILEAQAQTHLALGYAHSSLGFTQFDLGEMKAAKASFEKATSIMRKLRGNNSPDLPPGLIKLARIHSQAKEFKLAEQYLNEAISILRGIGASTPYGLVKAYSADASMALSKGDIQKAYTRSQDFMQIMRERLNLHRNSPVNLALEEQRQLRSLFMQYLDVAYQKMFAPDTNIFSRIIEAILRFLSGLFGIEYSKEQKSPDIEMLDEAFQVAQYPHMTGTASAISKMAARLEIDNKELESLLRQREQHVQELLSAENITIEQGLKKNSDALETASIETSNRSRVSNKIRGIDTKIRQMAPAVSELIHPRTASISELQKVLAEDELLLLQLTEVSGTFLFAVSQSDVRIKKTEMNLSALSDAVAGIRHAVDLTRSDISYDAMPDYDVASAYYLYQQVMQPFTDMLDKANHIVFIPDADMQNIPLGLLLTESYEVQKGYSVDHRALKFLGHQKALSVVPSPSSFIALREKAELSEAPEPFIGIGDPDLEQNSEVDSARLTMELIEEQLFRKKNTDVLRSIFASLPETQLELKEIARILNAPESKLYFRQDATESVLKSLPLNNYKVLGFATHGLLAEEFSGLSEPALVLTPPQRATAMDDGLLMASEVANLQLSADWVVLSACNTAAPEKKSGAEGLSGLAKAFFYAGAKSLLVSHWYIDSEASAMLTTEMLKHYANGANKTTRKAEALRQAMLHVFNHEQDYLAHPAFWGPFAVVGEGA